MSTLEPLQAIQRIGQIAVPVKDLDRATAFYTDVLGLRLRLEVQEMSFFDCGGVRLMLATSRGDVPQHASIIYYQVADIDAMYSALVARGVSFLQKPHMIAQLGAHALWMAFFRDTEDNTLALMCEKATQ
jgi:predicted enzyme related to lactoylglutathione lyase